MKSFVKDLYDFADFLDQFPSGKEKGKLSHFLTRFAECDKERILYKRLLDNRGDNSNV